MESNELDILASPRRAQPPSPQGNLFTGIKLSLLAVVLLLLSVLTIHLVETSENNVEEIEPVATNPHVEPVTATDLMENPTLTRTDSKGRLFTVSAASATRNLANSAEVTLKDVRADAAFNSPFRQNDQMFLHAASALLRSDDEQLDLFEPINIKTESDYQLQARHVNINLKQNQIEKADNIFINGPRGSIEADSMSTSADGQNFTFRDNVRVRWNLAPPAAPNTTPGPQ
ncbi:MAG: LPS export ABC transporter periplasmic protein LptC [Hyphomicrobiales bacterium]|nr:LPS export ABC transporter periplasmic protein LptC [Hyphomicrobiales bacterium]